MNIARRVFLCRKSLGVRNYRVSVTGVLREVCLVAACRSQSRVLAGVFPAHSACHGIRDLSNPTGTQRVGTVFGGLCMPEHTRFGVMTPRQGRTTSIRRETYAGIHENPTFRPPDWAAHLPAGALRMPRHTQPSIPVSRQDRMLPIQRTTYAGTYATQHFSNGYQPTNQPTNQSTRRITARRWFNVRRGMWGKSSLRGQTNR